MVSTSEASVLRRSAATFALDHIPDHGRDIGAAELRDLPMPVGEVTLISVR